MEFLRYAEKNVEVVTGPRGGKHLLIDDKRRYLTKEQKNRIFVKSVDELAEKLAEVVLEPESDPEPEMVTKVEDIASQKVADIELENTDSESKSEDDSESDSDTESSDVEKKWVV